VRLKTTYLILCVLGVALPYWQLAPWLLEHGLDLPLFFRQLFENRVGAFFGMDVFVSAAALLVFTRAEGRRAGVRGFWPVVLAVAAVGVSLGLPLFLYLRERSLERGG
jgi:Terpene cyclase DEP1